ncbi:MAG: 2-dehydropantoate 2-reductase [Lachnospiraceae bacterium]|nr:2-dehydropantoate 2-reductase [Lachnospiraceae bacterium]
MYNDYSTSRICVAGVGAIGTVIATMIGQRYESSLSLFARGKRAEALKKDGLVLHSDFYGERTARPAKVSNDAEELGEQDFVLVCVKNHALDTIARQLRPCIGQNTVIAPVMNGIEAADRLRELFPEAIVSDAVIYSATGMNEDFSATQRGGYAHVFIGCKDPDERQQQGARRLCEMLASAGFDSRFSDAIESENWQKFVHNCAFNTITARYLFTSGQLRRDERCRRDLRSILEEGYAVAKACGIDMPDDFVDRKFVFTTQTQAETATSSMRQDVEAGRPTELDAFLGALLRKARQHGVAVPVAEEYYEALSRK